MKRIIALIVSVVAMCSVCSAQLAKVQALYIYQFAKHTSWPQEDNDNPFVITVIGDNEIAEELRTATTARKVGARPIYVVNAESPRNLPKSDIIFLGQSQSNKIYSLLNDQAGKKVLIVGGAQGMCSQGASIALAQKSGKVTYEICEDNINRRGLRMSPKIVAQGKQVF